MYYWLLLFCDWPRPVHGEWFFEVWQFCQLQLSGVQNALPSETTKSREYRCGHCGPLFLGFHLNLFHDIFTDKTWLRMILDTFRYSYVPTLANQTNKRNVANFVWSLLVWTSWKSGFYRRSVPKRPQDQTNHSKSGAQVRPNLRDLNKIDAVSCWGSGCSGGNMRWSAQLSNSSKCQRSPLIWNCTLGISTCGSHWKLKGPKDLYAKNRSFCGVWRDKRKTM